MGSVDREVMGIIALCYLAIFELLVLIFGIPLILLFAHFGMDTPAAIVGCLFAIVVFRYITTFFVWAIAYVLEDFPKAAKILCRLVICMSILIQIMAVILFIVLAMGWLR